MFFGVCKNMFTERAWVRAADLAKCSTWCYLTKQTSIKYTVVPAASGNLTPIIEDVKLNFEPLIHICKIIIWTSLAFC